MNYLQIEFEIENEEVCVEKKKIPHPEVVSSCSTNCIKAPTISPDITDYSKERRKRKKKEKKTVEKNDTDDADDRFVSCFDIYLNYNNNFC